MVALCDADRNQRARSAAREAAAQRTWQRSAGVLLALLEGEAPRRQPLTRAPGMAIAFALKAFRKLTR